MRTIPLTGGPITVVGASELAEQPDGIVARRLPAWTRPQLDAFTELMVTMPSGVRLEFVTDSRHIELDVSVTKFRLPGRDVRPAAFDLEIAPDDVRTAEAATWGVNTFDLATREMAHEPGEPCTIRFADLPAGIKRCRLWLAHNATVAVRALRCDADALVEPLMFPRARWVHHGSSISHCSEARTPTATWPAVAARLAGVELINLGLGGSCHLDPYVARTMRDVRADAYSVKAGINIVNMDSMKERVFVPALHGFLDTIRETRPDTPIVVVSPIICPSAEDRPGPTLPDGHGRYATVSIEPEIRAGSMSLQRLRALMRDVVERRRAAGDANLHYLDGLGLFGADDVADLPDWLHPNTEGYRRMGERFHAQVFAPGGILAGL